MSDPWKNTIRIDDNAPLPPFKGGVSSCARCGGHHLDVVFLPFTNRPSAGYTHFGSCPKTQEPVLLTVRHFEFEQEFTEDKVKA